MCWKVPSKTSQHEIVSFIFYQSFYCKLMLVEGREDGIMLLVAFCTQIGWGSFPNTVRYEKLSEQRHQYARCSQYSCRTGITGAVAVIYSFYFVSSKLCLSCLNHVYGKKGQA